MKRGLKVASSSSRSKTLNSASMKRGLKVSQKLESSSNPSGRLNEKRIESIQNSINSTPHSPLPQWKEDWKEPFCPATRCRAFQSLNEKRIERNFRLRNSPEVPDSLNEKRIESWIRSSSHPGSANSLNEKRIERSRPSGSFVYPPLASMKRGLKGFGDALPPKSFSFRPQWKEDWKPSIYRFHSEGTA